VQVVAVPFDTLLAGKAAQGSYDLGLQQALIPKVKKSKVAFSASYLDFDLGILVRRGAVVADAVSARALRWGVWSGPSSADTYLTRLLKVSTPPQVFGDLAQAVTALANNQIDAVLDYTVSIMLQASTAPTRLAVAGQFRTGEQMGAVLPRRSKLVGPVNAALAALRADGTIGKLTMQYFGGDPSTVPFIRI
jgi:polar amino acid transport system substrate-binding protein